MQKLSLRLKTIADLVPQGAMVCDVGTDHGFLPVYLRETDKAQSVIATDINEKPLNKARENIEKSGALGVSLRLCDGLAAVSPLEADTVIIAGIGGEVISGILQRATHFAKRGVTFILQPTTSPEALRKFLCETGFRIEREIPLEENGKLYSVMLVYFADAPQKREAWFYFSGLVDASDPSGKKYIKKQKNRAFEIMNALKNIPQRQEEYNFNKEIFKNLSKLG